MALFEIMADQKTSKELDVALVMLTSNEDSGGSRKGITLTHELVEDAFDGDRGRAAEAVRSGVVDHEAMRRIGSPDKLVYQPQNADGASTAHWTLAVFSRDDLGLFEGPVRSEMKAGSPVGGTRT
ncbi:hypothetical protein QN224_04475 [Sinorhizobium sp. 8-89]|uniref:hypothetical protein n=1 Tax=Sinorhizobium sp. 7-81 TaxID=3049087 RepID=UPI0024C3CA14|nr:hypothetical protein [Sinorhizobium sp. 7-81]MDK1384661.1 hypothetical protein [Sinorhizobium sp. 7-81]